MSASEPIVGKLVDAASEGRKADRDALLSAASGHPAIDHAADQYAKRMALKQDAINKIFQPVVKMLGYSKDYFEQDFAGDMAPRLEQIPEGNLQPPKASIAGPAMEALRFSLEEEDLKSLYLSLLTTAADDRISDDAHPSFVEVIKKLSAIEARLFRGVIQHEERAIAIGKVHLRDIEEETPGFSSLSTHHLPNVLGGVEGFNDENAPTYVDNWMRLKLIDVNYGQYVTSEGSYDFMSASPEWADAQDRWREYGKTMELQRGTMSVTAYGARFAKAVGISRVDVGNGSVTT